ncbi:MAG: DPP IV N-terminal domain-containing protein [Bacteroidales bacterium]|nr:DPP IV N-terminal domain-containing protein [Bacteroidales bacterium]
MKLRISRMLLAAALMLVATQAVAQKQFTLEDLNFGGKNYRQMTPKNQSLFWWGDKLVHATDSLCTLVDVNTGKEKRLFSLEQLQECDDACASIRSLRGITYPYADQPLALAYTGQKRLLINFRTQKVVWSQDRSKELQASEWNKQSRAVAFVEGDNLYVRDAAGALMRLTKDGSRDIVYGQSVHRNEFGIGGGLFWNPAGTRLAFYRMDQSMVADYPLINVPEIDDTTRLMAAPAPEKYPMAGEKSHLVTIGVYDVASAKTVYLKAGDPTDRYFCGITWSPDGNTIYVQQMNRAQNDMHLLAYDAATGDSIAEIYHESHPKYVEPGTPLAFLPWDASQFILQSEKDGFNHLYLYNVNGRLIKPLTSGRWEVTRMVGFDTKRRAVVIESTEAHDLQNNIYRVDIASGARSRIDASGRGIHSCSLSESGALAVDWYQEPDVPRNIDFINTATGKATRYFTADDPWKGYAVPIYKNGSIKAADGTTDLYYRMVLPPDFDAQKKYPTVVYVYGGPHTRNVDAGWHWRSRSWETYMAQRGYVLFILDNRGSSRRGREFGLATYGQLGQIEMQDQMKGVDFLRTLPYVDMDRLGVHGWSFGGFMTISLMTNYPDVFKVGVAGGPVIDWKWYEVMYGERYMSTPQLNPEGYAKTSLLSKAKNLKGRLQIIHGLNDPVVLPQHSYAFLKACIAAGTQPDFFVYPGEPHNMRGHQSVHLHERITRYFDDHLK